MSITNSKASDNKLLPDVTLAAPRKEERRMVTDEQIDILASGGKDRAFEWAVALLATGFGVLDDLFAFFL
jgi:hypothetical protein